MSTTCPTSATKFCRDWRARGCGRRASTRSSVNCRTYSRRGRNPMVKDDAELLYRLMRFHRHSDVTVGGKPHLVAFNVSYQAHVDIMMMRRLMTDTAVLLGQLDSALFDSINGPDMHAVGPDDFHVLF